MNLLVRPMLPTFLWVALVYICNSGSGAVTAVPTTCTF